MLLVVDVGNTQTHFGAVRDAEIVEHWRFATDRSSTSDQLGAALRSLLALRGLSFEDVSASVLSSTVPELAPEWVEMARRYLEHEMLVVGPGVKTAMPIRMDNPRELGADRLVNAVAAWARFQRACIVVDFGTAITYDVVSADGEYLGGIISPGIEISLEALALRAAKVPQVELGEPRSLIGKTTAAGGAGPRRTGDRHRRAGPPPGAVVHRVDRRGRRPADAGGPAPDLGAQPLSVGGSATNVRIRFRHSSYGTSLKPSARDS